MTFYCLISGEHNEVTFSYSNLFGDKQTGWTFERPVFSPTTSESATRVVAQSFSVAWQLKWQLLGSLLKCLTRDKSRNPHLKHRSPIQPRGAHVHHTVAWHSSWWGVIYVVRLKDDLTLRGHGYSVAISQSQGLVIIQYTVEVLNPDGIHWSVQYDPDSFAWWQTHQALLSDYIVWLWLKQHNSTITHLNKPVK